MKRISSIINASQAAEAYEAEIFQNNPDGLTVGTYVNSGMFEDAYLSGYKKAVEDIGVIVEKNIKGSVDAEGSFYDGYYAAFDRLYHRLKELL